VAQLLRKRVRRAEVLKALKQQEERDNENDSEDDSEDEDDYSEEDSNEEGQRGLQQPGMLGADPAAKQCLTVAAE
jgi:hypothetical protein